MGIALEYREETGSPNGWSEGGKVVVNATLSTAAKCGTLAMSWRMSTFTGKAIAETT